MSHQTSSTACGIAAAVLIIIEQEVSFLFLARQNVLVFLVPVTKFHLFVCLVVCFVCVDHRIDSTVCARCFTYDADEGLRRDVCTMC